MGRKKLKQKTNILFQQFIELKHSNYLRLHLPLQSQNNRKKTTSIIRSSRNICKIRVIERKYTKGPQNLFELKRVSSYRDSSNREFFMRVY